MKQAIFGKDKNGNIVINRDIPDNLTLKFPGSVIIKGNIGSNVTLSIKDGGVLIYGNVGDNVTLSTKLDNDRSIICTESMTYINPQKNSSLLDFTNIKHTILSRTIAPINQTSSTPSIKQFVSVEKLKFVDRTNYKIRPCAADKFQLTRDFLEENIAYKEEIVVHLKKVLSGVHIKGQTGNNVTIDTDATVELEQNSGNYLYISASIINAKNIGNNSALNTKGFIHANRINANCHLTAISIQAYTAHSTAILNCPAENLKLTIPQQNSKVPMIEIC
jgi:hypothetical protein